MNFKTTITLLVLLVVTAGACWFMGVFSPQQEQGDRQRPAVVEAEKLLLISPMLGDVQKVRLEVAGRGHMVFVRDGGEDWKIVDPIDAPALPWEVSDLISAFAQARKLETVTPGQCDQAGTTLADLGLESPQYTVSFEEKDRTVTFLVGKNVVASENTYVKISGGKDVYIIDQNMKTRIKKNLADYRDKQLWELKKNKVTELVVTGRDGKEFRLARDAGGNWNILSPVRARADKKAIASAVEALSTLKAQEFTEDHPAELTPFGLTPPMWKVTVVETEEVKPATQGSQPASQPTLKRTEHVLLVGQPAGLNSDQVYAKLADNKWVVTIAQDSLTKILPDVMTWRDTSVVHVNKADITRVDIRRSAQDVTLVKENQNWKLRDGAETISTDEKRVTALLDTLAGLKAASFIDQPDKDLLKKSRLDSPACTITVYTGEKVAPIVLAIGETTPSGMFRYVKRNGVDYIAAVGTGAMEPLFTPAISYRDKQMMAFSVDTVKSIEIDHSNRSYKLVRPTPTAPWKVIAPVEAAADRDAVMNLLMGLATLKAQDFVARGYLANYELEHPQITATVNVEVDAPVINAGSAGSRPSTQTQPVTRLIKQQFVLAVSKHNDQYYAVRLGEDKPLVAKVTAQVYNDLSAELIDRNAFGDSSPSKDSVDRIVINTSDARSMEFQKVDGLWTFPADLVVKIDQEKLNQVLRTLSRLKAERYAEFEASNKTYGLEQPSLTITATAGQISWTLTVGKEAAGRENRYARTSGRPWIFEIKNSDMEKLNVSLKDLVKTQSADTATPPASAY